MVVLKIVTDGLDQVVGTRGTGVVHQNDILYAKTVCLNQHHVMETKATPLIFIYLNQTRVSSSVCIPALNIKFHYLPIYRTGLVFNVSSYGLKRLKGFIEWNRTWIIFLFNSISVPDLPVIVGAII